MKITALAITGCLAAFIPVVSAQETFNLAKYQSVTADSYASDKPEQFANDGFVSQDSRWVSSGSGPHWLEIELAVPMTIGSAHLFSGGTWNSAMSNFVLQYDHGGSWVDIAGTDVSGNTLPERNLMFTAPVTAQKFRLYTTDGTARVIDLALYPPTSDGSPVPFGTDVDLNLAKLRQVEASSISGENYPKLAIDGYADNTSCWVGSAGTQELEVSWLQGEKIRGIHLYSGLEGQAGTQIQNFNVDYWDGSAWVTFAGGSITGNTLLERDVRFDAAVTTTKIRLQSLDAAAPRIRELAVLPENNTGGYPLWTDVKDEAPPTADFMDYDDGYYAIKNRGTGLNLRTSTNGSSVVSAQDVWFQLLLNIGTDTYRLRSKDSGECFEVALASTDNGAQIVEGTYSSMPHQRWQLVDSGDGTHFRIVNVWSGKALDLDGVNVVQQTVDADHSQQWSFDYETHVPKKGQVAFFHYNYMYQPNWFYSWSATAENDCEYGDYHPQQWGWFTGSNPVILRDQPKWYSRAQMTCAMGFNEPDKPEQANIPEEDAADQWPRFERMQLPLVGPCPAQNNGSWRKNYEAIAEDRGLRSEYMALHWYAGCNQGSPQNIIDVINNVYNAYGKPIWITEFAVKDWSGKSTGWNRNDNYNWLAEFLWRAEGIAHLKKYSLFEWGVEDNNADPTVKDAPTMGLHVRNDKTNPGYEDLSECGLLLAGWDGDATVRNAKEYIIHNKGRSLRLIDHPASNTVTQANILHRAGTDQWMLQPAPGGKQYIIGVNDGRLLHYNGSSVGLSAAGTTGSAVEWSLQESQYGWFFINHPSTGKRLRIMSNNVINVDNDTNTGDNLKFRFIRPAQPIGIAETQPLPYSESFEDGVGAWVQSVTDDYDWRRNSGGTPTPGAGPSGASDGEFYLYAEGHDSGGGHKSTSIQCTFDLSGVSSAEMRFDYHMFGTYIDYLSLDVYDGSAWTSNVWIETGQQQSDSADAWLTATVDLDAYVGNSEVILRFRTKHKQWNSADPAIDNIQLEAALLTEYDLWVQDAFAGAPPGTDTTETGNPDGDSNANQLEWILATDPLVADSPITSMLFNDPNWITTYTRRKIDGISVYSEWSLELVPPDWDTIGLTEVKIGDDGEVETWAVLLPFAADQKYIRLRVEQ
ncbi:glycosyl hydrolase [Pontiellaceae bacterium B12227]|nr:glycosyl hydrolase [Pontiellaceae bacterium B12227]